MNTLYDFIKTHPPLVLSPAPLVGQLDVKAPPEPPELATSIRAWPAVPGRPCLLTGVHGAGEPGR